MQLVFLRSVVLMGIALSAGCGGSVMESVTDGGAAGMDGGLGSDGALGRDARADTGLFPDGAMGNACATASGVRLCGGACPSLSAGECPGLGCVGVLDRLTRERYSLGVCLPDIPAPQRSCGSCVDGQVCAHIDGQGPVCVAEDVCLALLKLGATRACRYADFAPYDGRPLAVATGAQCPKYACGPGCGWCQGERCTGRSADFGYGTCLNQSAAHACSARAAPPSVYCDSCLVWKPVPGDDPTSLDFGTCVSTGEVVCSRADVRMTCLP